MATRFFFYSGFPEHRNTGEGVYVLSQAVLRENSNLQPNTRIKHMESRDSQDGSASHIDVLVELELEPGTTVADATAAMKEKGLQVLKERKQWSSRKN